MTVWRHAQIDLALWDDRLRDTAVDLFEHLADPSDRRISVKDFTKFLHKYWPGGGTRAS